MKKLSIFFMGLLLLIVTNVSAQSTEQSDLKGFGIYSGAGVTNISSIAAIALAHMTDAEKKFENRWFFNFYAGADYTFLKNDRLKVFANFDVVPAKNRDFLLFNTGFLVKTGSYPNYLGITAGYQFLENWGAENGLTFGIQDTVYFPVGLKAILPFLQASVQIDLTTAMKIALTTGIRLNAHKINKNEV